MTIGKRMTLAREALGLSKGQLSKLIDVSYQTITDWEEDHNTPRPSRFETLAKVLQVPSEWLVLGEGDFSPTCQTALSYQIKTFRADAVQSLDSQNQLVKKIEVQEEWLRNIVGYDNANRLSILTYHGDAMNPTLVSGDILLVDQNISEISRGAIYVAAINGKLYINRFYIRPDGKTVMINDNHIYGSYILQDSDQLEILGRVILRLAAIRQ